MNAEDMARLLHGRRYGGTLWMARCPVHGANGGDSSPSLSIREGKKGVLLYCFAGCPARDVISALGLTFRDLGFDSEPSWKRRAISSKMSPPRDRKPLGKREAIYRYVDSMGNLIAEKLRFEGKIFLWRKPSGVGGWEWKVDRDKLPLYRLDEVVKAKVVVLTEGEKDVESFRGLGMTATTAPNGANSWRAGFSSYFAQKKVIIVPDTDKPGMEYARAAAAGIVKVADMVLICSVSPAKDVTDYLAANSPAALSLRMKHGLRFVPGDSL